MKAIWKGHIRFSLVTIPIRIYNAIETSSTIRFNQLHKEDNGRIGYEKVCKKCNKKVSADDIVKGYEYESDQYAIVESEDFDKVKLKSTKVIEIEGFVDKSEVHPTLFDSPYFAGPDGEVAAKTYALLSETLKASGKIGVGRVVLRDRESIMLMTANEKGILLYKLRYPSEVRNITDVPLIDEAVTDDEQLQLAEMLVEKMTAKFEDLDLKDRYKSGLLEVIENKIAGKEVVTVAEEDEPVKDIMTALKQSIDQAKADKKPMEKAKGKKESSKKKTTKSKKSKTA
ncbi:MAG: Ku protein [Chitinophagales bacterium]|nr:Ku protein [Chitinophagales bacterium]